MRLIYKGYRSWDQYTKDTDHEINIQRIQIMRLIYKGYRSWGSTLSAETCCIVSPGTLDQGPPWTSYKYDWIWSCKFCTYDILMVYDSICKDIDINRLLRGTNIRGVKQTTCTVPEVQKSTIILHVGTNDLKKMSANEAFIRLFVWLLLYWSLSKVGWYLYLYK
jgi:hypothetical protein